MPYDATAVRENDGKAPDAPEKRRSPLVWIILGVVAVLAVAGGTYYWYSTKDQQSTDDAYTDGRAITIAPKIAGYITELNITDNQRVHVGDVLLRIDQRDYIAARDQARGMVVAAEGQFAAATAGSEVARKNFPARLASAQAQRDAARAALVRAQADIRPQHSLASGATTQQAIDEASAAMLQAQATVGQAEAAVIEAEPVKANVAQVDAQGSQIGGTLAQARAQLAQAEINLTYTVITAPQDGWITKRNVERGTYVAAGASAFSIVTPDVWVVANFKESQLNRIRAGQQVSIVVDAYPGLKLRGHVDSLQMGSGSKFTAFPPENATGNYVKIVQRVPLKVVIDQGLDPNLPLPLGLSVTPTVLLE